MQQTNGHLFLIGIQIKTQGPAGALLHLLNYFFGAAVFRLHPGAFAWFKHFGQTLRAFSRVAAQRVLPYNGYFSVGVFFGYFFHTRKYKYSGVPARMSSAGTDALRAEVVSPHPFTPFARARYPLQVLVPLVLYPL